MTSTEFTAWDIGPLAINRLSFPAGETYYHLKLGDGFNQIQVWFDFNG